jgi:hypothetical protein
MKHACINNNIIEKIVEITNESQYHEMTSIYSVVILIEDLLIPPQVGWVLNSNNVLEPGEGQTIPIQDIIRYKIKQYQEQAPELLRDLYMENTLLGITTAQSDQMFDEFKDVLVRIREGAWPTALYRLSQKQPSGFVTQEMINKWYNLILSKMI